jgi:hypothetical protein
MVNIEDLEYDKFDINDTGDVVVDFIETTEDPLTNVE